MWVGEVYRSRHMQRTKEIFPYSVDFLLLVCALSFSYRRALCVGGIDSPMTRPVAFSSHQSSEMSSRLLSSLLRGRAFAFVRALSFVCLSSSFSLLIPQPKSNQINQQNTQQLNAKIPIPPIQ